MILFIKTIYFAVASLSVLAAMGCLNQDDKQQPTAGKNISTESIGQATMKNDGTIVLQLRAEGPGAQMGDSLLEYPPHHKDYEMIRKHIGDIHPGQTVPVKPWSNPWQ